MSNTQQGQVTIPLHRPGLREQLFFFASGIIVSVPMAIFFESALPTLYAFPATISVGILAPIIEEFGKAYPLFFRHGETKKSIMNLGLLVGLGFGIVELLEYVLILQYPIIVRIPGLLFHMASTSIVGYGIANKKSAAFYMIAVILHMTNNLAALINPFQFLSIVIVLLTLYISFYLYQETPEKLIPY